MLKLTLTPAAKAHFRASFEKKIGEKIEAEASKLLDAVLRHTPMNTGRTLASWYVSRRIPTGYDAVSDFPGEFDYPPDHGNRTNGLPIGSESGRRRFEGHARKSLSAAGIAKRPFDLFVISNAAKLDPITGSPLRNDPGSRAFYMDVGAVPGYDLIHDRDNVFDPRGTSMLALAVASFLAR